MESTSRKPFVFVLMPFDSRFDDVYKFGIKGAAEDAEAYAERVDEQMFVEGILDRILNQINEADVIVADMTERNPNVFYEVGYAHALNKIALLATQNSDDIPFDLKHRPHTVYAGSIERLRKDLGPKIRWAINESEKQRPKGGVERMSISIGNVEVPEGVASEQSPEIAGIVSGDSFSLPLYLRNDGKKPLESISHVYLFTSENTETVPAEMRSTYYDAASAPSAARLRYFGRPLPARTRVELPDFRAREIDAPDGLTKQYRLSVEFTKTPPGAIEKSEILFSMREPGCRSRYRLRLCTADGFFDFGFRLHIEQPKARSRSPMPESTAPTASQ